MVVKPYKQPGMVGVGVHQQRMTLPDPGLVPWSSVGGLQLPAGSQSDPRFHAMGSIPRNYSTSGKLPLFSWKSLRQGKCKAGISMRWGVAIYFGPFGQDLAGNWHQSWHSFSITDRGSRAEGVPMEVPLGGPAQHERQFTNIFSARRLISRAFYGL